MLSSKAMSLKDRITQLFWVGNAIFCALVALQGALLYFGVFGFDAQLAGLSMRVGALLGVTSATLAAFSVRKARSLAMSRN
jgi:hypothetical protein